MRSCPERERERDGKAEIKKVCLGNEMSIL